MNDIYQEYLREIPSISTETVICDYDCSSLIYTTNWQIMRKNMKYSEILAQELARQLEKEKRIFDKYGDEPELDGTIIKWESQYRVRGIWYSFAAIKAGGYWYKTTGVNQLKYKFTWEELVDWLEGLIQVRKFKVVYVPKDKK